VVEYEKAVFKVRFKINFKKNHKSMEIEISQELAVLHLIKFTLENDCSHL